MNWWREILPSFLLNFSRKIKESLECFPVKLNNLIHVLAQMSAVSPAEPPPQTSSQESCTLSTARSIQRATILGFSKKPSDVSLKSVILSPSPPLLHILSFFHYANEKISYNLSSSATKRMFLRKNHNNRAISREPSKGTVPALW